MVAVLADTHAILRYLTADARISRAAAADRDNATTAGAIPFRFRHHNGGDPILRRKGALSTDDQRIVVAAVYAVRDLARLVPVARIVVDELGQINRDKAPYLIDRIIAATALAPGVPPVRRDRKICASSDLRIFGRDHLALNLEGIRG